MPSHFYFVSILKKNQQLHFVSESVDPEINQCFHYFPGETLLGFISQKYKFLHLYCFLRIHY